VLLINDRLYAIGYDYLAQCQDELEARSPDVILQLIPDLGFKHIRKRWPEPPPANKKKKEEEP